MPQDPDLLFSHGSCREWQYASMARGDSTHMQLFDDLVAAHRENTLFDDPLVSEVDVRYYTSEAWLQRDQKEI